MSKIYTLINICRIKFMIKVFGIKNCDTMKKTFTWLDAHSVEYKFIDYKKEGVVAEQIDVWINHVGWEKLLNTRGMMWRKIPDDEKLDLDEEIARRLMLAYPSAIKRPIILCKDKLLVGFDADFFMTELLA